jgi:TPR repeat protein
MPKAAYNLASLYYHGIRLPKSLSKSLKLYREAATLGHTEAAFTLGYMLEYGLGAPKDTDKARYWYKEAAINGHKNARKNLGLLLKNEGKKDEAVYWLERAN